VGGDENHGVGVLGHEPGRLLQEPPRARVGAVAIPHDAEYVAAAECDYERQSFGKRQQATLPELRMDQVVARAMEAAPQPCPGAQVIVGILLTVEGKYIHFHARALHEFRLAADEGGRARNAGDGPVAGDHQDAQRFGATCGARPRARLGRARTARARLTFSDANTLESPGSARVASKKQAGRAG
jgi:hypothetical protein